ncbi:MAG TPA: RluA family pseudouridine synthase [Pyrinomonadaceae bacterium]|jgi:23S rRNA pseudouridine1911/1915/1917 synthase|nr:RluA family pseudouridine synthase [Pyrinomonadaceae bacterium]
MEDRLKVPADDAGIRLDAYLASQIEGWSRSRLQRLIDEGDVLVNGAEVKSSYKLREGDEIEVDLVELPAVTFEAEDIPLDIVYEDEYLAVINKPAGMVVHPGAGVQSGTLANAIAFRFGSDVDGPRSTDENRSRVGIVHRLDKDTSGLIVVARTDEIHEALSEQFRAREVYKSYIALVHGSTDQEFGKIEAPIARNKHNRLRMRVAAQGRPAISLWKVRERYGKFTLLDVEIKTGRTHQIRVHMAYINHPVVGDEIYNEGRDNTIADINIRNAIASLPRFFLHAEQLSFTHPKTGERMEFLQELPKELVEFLSHL